MTLCGHPVVFMDVFDLPTIGGRRPSAQEVTKRSHVGMRSKSKSRKRSDIGLLREVPDIWSVSV
jgi:hypothetical protein